MTFGTARIPNYRSLADVNVSGTPTLLLIDQTGHVLRVWVGKLDENRERDVMQQAFERQ